MGCEASACVQTRDTWQPHRTALLHAAASSEPPAREGSRCWQVAGALGDFRNPPLGSYPGQGTVACSCQHRALLGSFPENSSQGKVRASFHKSDAGSQLLVVPRTENPRLHQVGAECPLLASLLHAGLATGPTRTRLLGAVGLQGTGSIGSQGALSLGCYPTQGPHSPVFQSTGFYSF